MDNEERFSFLEAKMEREGERLYSQYRQQMDLLDKSLYAKVKGRLAPYDYYALGRQLEAFEGYMYICESDGNMGQLGRIPDIAFDVVTIAYGASIIPFVASVQPIDEERGTVYFRQVRAGQAKGNLGLEQVFIDPRTGIVTPYAFAANYVTNEASGNTSAPGKTYGFSLAQYPVRPRSVSIIISGTSVALTDDGLGNLTGVGGAGTITYGDSTTPGVVSITLIAAPGDIYAILSSYQVNYELATDIPNIDSYFDSQTILAKVFALKGTIGMFQSYALKKRFGLVAEDELAKDLVNEINSEIGGTLIRLLAANAVSTTTWPGKAPASVSYFEHKQTYKDSLATAESALVGNAGRGTITGLIAGRNHCAVLSTLPGFVKLTDGNTIGAHVYGTLDGMLIIRVLEAAMLGTNAGVAFWKGPSPFEAPVVYSPYMPLVVTTTLPIGKNPLLNQRAVAVWAGLDILVANFATNFDIDPTESPDDI